MARLRQYETILKKWKQGKYIKHREMEAIVRKTQQRNLVDVNRGALAFKVREKPIETERIQRWMRTRGIPDDELYAPNSPEREYIMIGCVSHRLTLLSNPL